MMNKADRKEMSNIVDTLNALGVGMYFVAYDDGDVQIGVAEGRTVHNAIAVLREVADNLEKGDRNYLGVFKPNRKPMF